MPFINILRFACLATSSILLLSPVVASGETRLGKFRVELNSGEQVLAHEGRVDAGLIHALDQDDKPITIQMADVTKLEVKPNKAGKGFLVGALGGAALFATALVFAEMLDPYGHQERKNVAGVGAILILGGGAIGAGFGATAASWEQMPLDEISLSPAHDTGFTITWNSSW
jgi:hypothetical protein